MASIYVHIPYCKQACIYCDFHFSTQHKNIPQLLSAIVQEIELQRNFFQPQQTLINTIYFGGGTPSLVNPIYLQNIIKNIYHTFNVAPELELTLEINPDDVNINNIKQWQQIGFNRFSLGVQSFNDKDLQYLKRSHNVTQTKKSIELLQQHNIKNISIDLIFGLPNTTFKNLQNNIENFIHYDFPHLSYYGLTIEPNTLLYHNIKNKKLPDINLQHQADDFLYIMETLQKNNFEQYEISNYSKPNFKSQHNSSYWNNQPYLGLGPSAHSYNQHQRFFNIKNNALYIKSIDNKQLPNIVENLSITNLFNEFILTNIRKMEGINLIQLKEQFGLELHNTFKKNLQQVNHKFIIQDNNKLYLTQEGKLFCDTITLQLIL